MDLGKVGKVCIRAKWPIRSELIPVSVAWSHWKYFYSPLDGMLVHRRVTPSIKFAGTYLYTWAERGTVGVKCLAQERNTMSPARARTRTARSGVECTNHEATAPPTDGPEWRNKFMDFSNREEGIMGSKRRQKEDSAPPPPPTPPLFLSPLFRTWLCISLACYMLGLSRPGFGCV